MKKILNFAFAISLVSLGACTNSNVNGNSDGADSLNSDSAQMTNEIAQNVVDDIKFASPDLALFDLHGQVKTCAYSSNSCDKDGNVKGNYDLEERNYVFDNDGFIDVKSKELSWRMNDPKLERNDSKQIKKASWYVSDFGCDVYEEYTYNKLGLVATADKTGIENVESIKYEYDADKLVKTVSESAGEGSVFRTVRTYKIMDEDSKGNWTRRFIKEEMEMGNDDGSGKYELLETNYLLEERNIVYYE